MRASTLLAFTDGLHSPCRAYDFLIRTTFAFSCVWCSTSLRILAQCFHAQDVENDCFRIIVKNTFFERVFANHALQPDAAADSHDMQHSHNIRLLFSTARRWSLASSRS